MIQYMCGQGMNRPTRAVNKHDIMTAKEKMMVRICNLMGIGILVGIALCAATCIASDHPLLGKAAPALTLDVMDGGKFDLAALKGKIVIMDFWATWCPPCRAALPIYVKVADKLKDKDVVFYGVNLKEAPEQIKAFQKKNSLKFSVALDSKLDGARLYEVESIPQLVVVGKDGVIEAVHVGLAPDAETDLTKELETLAAGKSLVKKDEKK